MAGASTQVMMAEEHQEPATPAKAGAWGVLEPVRSSDGVEMGAVYLTKAQFTIGRDLSCDLVFSGHNYVSGIHCTIQRSHGSTMIVDRSSNGTFLEDKRIKKGELVNLHSGTRIALLPLKELSHRIEYVYRELAESPETAFHRQYDMDTTALGEGAFAKVYSCLNRATGQRYAVKCINKKTSLMLHAKPEKIMEEVSILKAIQHPNVISIIDVFDLEEELYIVLDLVTGGDLLTRTLESGRFVEAAAKTIVTQILEAVRYLHSQGIVHRDLKPENILLRDRESLVVLVSDFGLSRIIDKDVFMRTICGTMEYIAPEILIHGEKRGYGMEVDMWSVGVIVYILLSGRMPFSNPAHIKAGLYSLDPQFFGAVSDDAKDFIRKLLDVDSTRRLSAEAALSHPWLGVQYSTFAEPMSLATQAMPMFGAGAHTLDPAGTGTVDSAAESGEDSSRNLALEIKEQIASAGGATGLTAEDIVGLLEASERRGDRVEFGRRVATALNKMQSAKAVVCARGYYKLVV